MFFSQMPILPLHCSSSSSLLSSSLPPLCASARRRHLLSAAGSPWLRCRLQGPSAAATSPWSRTPSGPFVAATNREGTPPIPGSDRAPPPPAGAVEAMGSRALENAAADVDAAASAVEVVPTKAGSYAVLQCDEDSEYVHKAYGGYFEVFRALLAEDGERWRPLITLK
ncbi:hypothetical protein GUJ93_ZPchr0004g38182 [Zizania palustris]|uniref:Uncharacterized protein n=1 Tax=Zizania palustris TaxID=103762 RepID=A0A8J5SXU2_ZIZPA|nr:hypothetical protein GUJ93_ZPchr0004g38182 [Zizania palustris]